MAEKSRKGAIRPWLWRSRLRRVGDPNATRMGLERTETCCGQERGTRGNYFVIGGKECEEHSVFWIANWWLCAFRREQRSSPPLKQ
jgi:hypothetical protein